MKPAIAVTDLNHQIRGNGMTTLFLSLIWSRIMNQPVELSLEQQFSIRSFETQVQQMSREQAQDFLIKLYEQMVMRENMYKHFLKHQWGLEPGPL